MPKDGDTVVAGVEERVEDGSSFQAGGAALALGLPEAKIVDFAVVRMFGKVGDKQYLPPFHAHLGQTGAEVELKPAVLLVGVVTTLEEGPLRNGFDVGVDEGSAIFHVLAYFNLFLIDYQQFADVCLFPAELLQHEHQQGEIQQILLDFAVVLQIVVLHKLLGLQFDADAHTVVSPTAEVLAQTRKHPIFELGLPLQLLSFPGVLLVLLQGGCGPEGLEGSDKGPAHECVHSAPDGVLDEHGEVVVVAVVLLGEGVGGQMRHEVLEDLRDFAGVVLESPAESIDAVQVGPFGLHGVALPGAPLLHHAVDLVPQSLYFRTHPHPVGWNGLRRLSLLQVGVAGRFAASLLGEEDALETAQLFLLGHLIEISLAHSKSNNNCRLPQ